MYKTFRAFKNSLLSDFSTSFNGKQLPLKEYLKSTGKHPNSPKDEEKMEQITEKKMKASNFTYCLKFRPRLFKIQGKKTQTRIANHMFICPYHIIITAKKNN